MKTKRTILAALALIAAFVVGYIASQTGFTAKEHQRKEPDIVKETVIDTILYRMPVPEPELAAGTQLYTLPIYRFIGGGCGGVVRQRGAEATDSATSISSTIGADLDSSADSVIVELPIIRRHYADSTYEAWVSGPVDPRLDSLIVFAPTNTITRTEWKPPKRWHIGPTIGCGYTPAGFQPFVGVSITYSIYSW